jgi:hypothetical protein
LRTPSPPPRRRSPSPPRRPRTPPTRARSPGPDFISLQLPAAPSTTTANSVALPPSRPGRSSAPVSLPPRPAVPVVKLPAKPAAVPLQRREFNFIPPPAVPKNNAQHNDRRAAPPPARPAAAPRVKPPPSPVAPRAVVVSAADVERRVSTQIAEINGRLESFSERLDGNSALFDKGAKLLRTETKRVLAELEASRAAVVTEPKAKRKKQKAKLKKYTDERVAQLQQLVEANSVLQAHMVINISTLYEKLEETRALLLQPLANAAQPPVVYGPPNGWVVPMLTDEEADCMSAGTILSMPSKAATESRRRRAAGRNGASSALPQKSIPGSSDKGITVARLSGTN